jgi:uncharacterized protein
MIGVDTNILVYARRAELPPHPRALELLRGLAEGDQPWALPWPCVYEFVRVVTHPRVFTPASDLGVVLEDLESLLASPSLLLLGEGPAHASHLRRVLMDGNATANLVHDGHIAALVLEHGVTEFWTADRDFARFRGVRARNPLQG